MEHVTCPFDSECADEPCWEENGFFGHRCSRCGVIFISPRPDEQAMAALYDADAAGGASAEGHLTFTHERRLDARYALDIIGGLAGKPSGGETLLEVGPGGGQFLCEARERGYRPYAIELNTAQASFIRDRLDIPTHPGAVTDPDVFRGQRFDVIFHRDLVSHLHRPVETFIQLRERLQPGGIMVFETGNGGDLDARWLRFIGRLSYPEHLYLFGERSLGMLLDAAGLELIDVRRHSIVPWLAAIRLIRSVRPKRAAPPERGEPASDTAAITASPSLSRRIKGRLVHTVKYRASRWLPRRWPATLLVAAQARS